MSDGQDIPWDVLSDALADHDGKKMLQEDYREPKWVADARKVIIERPNESVVSKFVEIQKGHLFSPEDAAKRELWARRFVTEITGVARGLGYGMFQGGGLVRDIDLIALPWRSGGSMFRDGKFLTHVEFVLELCHCLPLKMGNHGETLFGHRWYALWHTSHCDHQIDLKVILPADKEPNG